MKGGPKIAYKTRLSKNINYLNIMKSYEENKLLGGASCKNHIFLNAFARRDLGRLLFYIVFYFTFAPHFSKVKVCQ
jgi:hypothetical protein